MNPAAMATASPRLLLDYPIEAFAAIVLRYLGDGYIPPKSPALCEGWVEDYKRTINDPTSRPIESILRADPGPKGEFESVPEGHASWPLFAIWRANNAWQQHTVGVDKCRVLVRFIWALPRHSETERLWPLLGVFDFYLRRILMNLYRDPESKRLLNAALVRDYALPWQSYRTEQGGKGPGNQALYLTLSGQFEFDTYWERTIQALDITPPDFNAAYFSYLLQYRKESGSIADARLIPELASIVTPIFQG